MNAGQHIDGFEAPIHRALVEPILLGGAPRGVAILNGTLAAARAEVGAAVDTLVHYAGWTDKFAAVMGGINPVAMPYLSFSVPEPTGVVAVLAPQESSLLGLVSVVAPVVTVGNTCVVTASAARPLPAITLAEVLATSDVPGGVVNILTGSLADTVPTLASHMDVNAIDLTGVRDGADLERLAAENVKRVVRGSPDGQHLSEIVAFLELKTVWHPIGT